MGNVTKVAYFTLKRKLKTDFRYQFFHNNLAKICPFH